MLDYSPKPYDNHNIDPSNGRSIEEISMRTLVEEDQQLALVKKTDKGPDEIIGHIMTISRFNQNN